MDEQLDNELKKRIQQVFENLDDTTADEGWLLLREKFPEKESKRRGLIWLWWGSAAAVLFIFLGIGLWYFNKNDADTSGKQFAVKPIKHSQSLITITPKKTVNDTGINSRSATEKQSQLANTSNKKNKISKDTYQPAKQSQQQIASLTKKPENDSAKYDHSANGEGQSLIAGASNKKNNIGKDAYQPAKQNQQQIASVTKKPGNDSAKYDHSANGEGQSLIAGASNKKSNKAKTVTQPVIQNQQQTNSSLIAKNNSAAQQTKVNPDNQNKVNLDKKNPSANPVITGDKITQESLAANNETEDVANPVNKTSQSQISVTAKVDTTSAKKIAATPKPVKKTIEDMFAEDKQITPKKKKDDKKSDDKLVHFGVYAATYFSYAKGSDDEVNVGGGFSSDIKINNNLKLVTGVAIGQNTLSYPGTGTSPTNSSSSSSSYFAAAANTAVPAAYANYAQVATPSIKNYNASLVGLDIPLNLKYQINPQKSDTYILAGVSSGTFINESYTYFYNYPAVSSVTLQQTQGATTSKSFDGFYFAKTLNLAFGMGYPLGNNRLIIEPFLKYPLEGLGSEQIRFGAGGINLKFNFSSKK